MRLVSKWNALFPTEIPNGNFPKFLVNGKQPWNSKSGNFPDGYSSPGGPSRSIQFRTEISRNLRQRGTANRNFFEWNSNFPSERTNRKSGPPRKVDLLFRKFPDWSEPFHSVSDRNFRKFWLNGKRPQSRVCHATNVRFFKLYRFQSTHRTQSTENLRSVLKVVNVGRQK